MVNVTASYSPQKIYFEGSKSFALLAAAFFTFDSPGIYPQIYYRTPCPAVLICKGI